MSRWQLLDRIENWGNRLPNPTMLFLILAVAILVLSAVCAALGLKAQNPTSGEWLSAINLLSRDGLHRILQNTVTNFTGFAPVGTVLVAVLGIGVAEHSGLIGAALRATILKAPRALLTFAIVIAGILSSLAADTGYVILIPLAAMVFASVGRNPIVGIAAAFAGVSGGFSANLLVGPLDAILAGISAESARLVAPDYDVNAAANYYFMLVSTALIGAVGTWVTERIVAPRFPDSATYTNTETMAEGLSSAEKRGLLAVLIWTLLFCALLVAGLAPPQGVLRNPVTGDVLTSPFIRGIVTVIAFYAAIAGVIFGRVSGHYKKNSDFVAGMEKNMATMANYLVLMFFAAQFISYFAWSNLGSIIAINGASLLNQWSLPPALLLVAFIILAAFINLFIGSASAKWALLAPVFVPMLLLSGITPEAAQVAYRIGDSSTNIITPLMPYFGVVVAFAQQYRKDIGIGSLIAMMLPYSLFFLLSWSALLIVWTWLDWPLGPGASVQLPPVAP